MHSSTGAFGSQRMPVRIPGTPVHLFLHSAEPSPEFSSNEPQQIWPVAQSVRSSQAILLAAPHGIKPFAGLHSNVGWPFPIPPKEAQHTCVPDVHAGPLPHATVVVGGGGGGGAESFPASFFPPELPLDPEDEDEEEEGLPELPLELEVELDDEPGSSPPLESSGSVGVLFDFAKSPDPSVPLHATTAPTRRAGVKKRRSFIERPQTYPLSFGSRHEPTPPFRLNG
jgi:hypothetical protein